MSEGKKDFYLYIGGQSVKVDEQIYREYKRAEEKERYFMRRLKKGRFIVDSDGQSVTYCQSREASLEKLMEMDWDFAAPGESVEEAVVKELMLEKLKKALCELTQEEMELIQELFFQEKSEREACVSLGMPKTSLHRKKAMILKKLRMLMEKR